MRVRYPAFPLRRTTPKPGSGELRLLFTGHHFMRKGGPVLLRAHERLRAAGVPVTTTIVSGLAGSPRTTSARARPRSWSASCSASPRPGVEHLGSVPNARVLELMEEADYFVLPTFHDTFGYVALEALAGGTPVIASDTCALPEVVEHGRNGYLIPFENDAEVGRWPWISRRHDPHYDEAYEAQTERMADSLTAILSEAYETRASYGERSAAVDRAHALTLRPDGGARRARARLRALPGQVVAPARAAAARPLAMPPQSHRPEL